MKGIPVECPRCGIENPQSAETCFSCGWSFSDDPAGFRPRLSKLAVVAFVLGVLNLLTFFLLLVPTVIVGAIAIRRIRRAHGRLTGERLAIAGILIPLIGIPAALSFGRGLWRLDAGPVPNEFTMADLAAVRPVNESSYELLCRLNDHKDDPDGAPAIGLNKEDIDLLDSIHDAVSDPNSIEDRFAASLEHRADILRLWHKGQKGIEVIHQLSEYDEIADMMMPDIEAEFVASLDLKYLSWLVECYVISEAAAGRYQAVEELTTFDDVIRKFSVNSRAMIAKLLCFAVLVTDTDTVSVICSQPSVPEKTLQTLVEHFQLAEEQTSLRNTLVFEYLLYKNELIKMQAGFGGKASWTLKENSSLRFYQSCIQREICLTVGEPCAEYSPVSVWPWDYPNWPKVKLDADNNRLYYLYNPVGYMIVQIMLPAHQKIKEIKTRVEIQHDLLQWILECRLGGEESLKARAYGDAYVVDIEKKLVYSLGPDGEAFTKDDIKLRINPDLLGLEQGAAPYPPEDR